MTDFLLAAAGLHPVHRRGRLPRALRGPSNADRIMAIQLFRTAGIASLLLIASATEVPGVGDVALSLAVLSAFRDRLPWSPTRPRRRTKVEARARPIRRRRSRCGRVFLSRRLVGLLRFPDSLTRLHALSKADNLGLGLIALGLLLRTESVLGGLRLVMIWGVVQETLELNHLHSFNRVGATTIFVDLKGGTTARQVPDIWYHVRKCVGDMRQTLPSGVQGSLLQRSSLTCVTGAPVNTVFNAFATACELKPNWRASFWSTLMRICRPGSNQSKLTVPLMLLVMLTVRMFKLRSFQRLAIVLSVGPLGLIGVVPALLLSGRPLGFVAILGVLALIGMITKNAVIPIGQIESERAAGEDVWNAVIDASSARFPPILLTAVSTVLGLIPIAPTVFWAPMAFAIMGGLLVATVLTLVFLPTLYATWFRGQEKPAA